MSADIKERLKNHKLWPYKEAEGILARHDFDPSYEYRFQTGFGPSGFPHIGTFGEAVRTGFIMDAVRSLGFKTRLIVFSDDLDGLRKVPEDMPQWLASHLGKPVSAIPDPFGDEESFSAQMNSRLLKMLDGMGFEYEFKSSRETYSSGEFDEAIKILLRGFKDLESIIAPTLSEDTLKDWHPFFPICERCGKVLTTVVRHVDTETFMVEYECSKRHGLIEGCGYHGTRSALGGGGKLTWRVDWPLRWFALDIDYELYGKDLIDSFTIGRKIMNRVFRTREPNNMFYEMFLDEQGAKISKSKGKGLTVDGWLRYGTPESLALLMFRKPKKAKELSFGIIPRYVDDATALSIDFHRQETAPPEHEFFFVTLGRPGEKHYPDVSMGLIINLMSALKSTDRAFIETYLGHIIERAWLEDPTRRPILDDLVDKAANYYEDFVHGHERVFGFTPEERAMLEGFVAYLGERERSSDEIHNAIYDLAPAYGMDSAGMFKTLYHALIGQDRGPRLGNFVAMLGAGKATEIIRAALGKG